jgi:4-hydroxy-3-polyprenylbenzoate decarboxylase
MYRLRVLGPRSTWQLHKDGRADYPPPPGAAEVAVALGLDRSPPTASALPKHRRADVAGFLRGQAVDVVKGVTVDVEAPAAAETCSRATSSGDLAEEGPFGDHTGFYTAAEPFPVSM